MKSYGYFSQKDCDRWGYFIYTRPDGSCIKVTEVSPEEVGQVDDLQLVGEVTRFVSAYLTKEGDKTL